MKSIKLPEYQGNIIRALRSLELTDMDTPIPEMDEVLIKVEAAPCNPSDLAFIQGGYNVMKVLPATPGFEGTGMVIETGNSPEAKELMGKRVSFFSQSDKGGSWASHIPVNTGDCIIIGDELPSDMAACFSVNPFTAYAMVELASERTSKAIIQNAAGGQVARFINVLAGLKGIEVINIVRKEEQISMLKTLGYKHILWHLDDNFSQQLCKLATDLEAKVAFDAVGGEQSGHILQAMPHGSSLYLYGALGARTLSEIPATDVIFKNKSILGFNLNEWKDQLPKEAFNKVATELEDLFISGKMHTQIQGSFKLSEHSDALMQYIRNMSAGKVLLIPDEA